MIRPDTLLNAHVTNCTVQVTAGPSHLLTEQEPYHDMSSHQRS